MTLLEPTLRLDELRAGRCERRGLLSSSLLEPGMDERIRPAEQMEAEIRADLENGELRVEGSARCKTIALCDLCLTEFSLPLAWTFSLRRAVGGEKAFDPRPEIREAFYLSVPRRILCRPDCRGMCPECGQNLNEGRCSHAAS